LNSIEILPVNCKFIRDVLSLTLSAKKDMNTDKLANNGKISLEFDFGLSLLL